MIIHRHHPEEFFLYITLEKNYFTAKTVDSEVCGLSKLIRTLFLEDDKYYC